MNLRDIIERIGANRQIIYTMEEMEFVIQEYIRAKKGVTVEINTLQGLDQSLPHFVLESLAKHQLELLNAAFGIAHKYFNK